MKTLLILSAVVAAFAAGLFTESKKHFIAPPPVQASERQQVTEDHQPRKLSTALAVLCLSISNACDESQRMALDKGSVQLHIEGLRHYESELNRWCEKARFHPLEITALGLAGKLGATANTVKDTDARSESFNGTDAFLVGQYATIAKDARDLMTLANAH